MSKSLAKLYYLEQLSIKKDHHRKIANRLTYKFDVSAADIKTELLQEGYIKLDKAVKNSKTGKNNYYYVPTGKPVLSNEKPVTMDNFWPCGTKKSTGNAFDLSIKLCTMFGKSEIARMSQKYNNNNPITIYSRA